MRVPYKLLVIWQVCYYPSSFIIIQNSKINLSSFQISILRGRYDHHHRQNMKMMARLVLVLKASWLPIQLVSASYTGSCHYLQSSALSFVSQNPCRALWTAEGFLLGCPC